MDNNIVPFGKYAGRSINELINDKSYMLYVIGQSWVLKKYPELIEKINLCLILPSKEKLKTELKNMTNGIKIVSRLLRTFDLNQKFNNEMIEYLLTFHPEKNIKKVEYLILIPNIYKDKTLYLKSVDDKDMLDISWINCIKNLFGNFDAEKDKKQCIISSFRNCISNDLQNFKSSNKKKDENYICSECSIVVKECDVDHYPTVFSEILDKFINLENISIDNIQIKDDGILYVLSDKNLSNKFKKYHNDTASYRILCKKCNRTNGDYGYKKRK